MPTSLTPPAWRSIHLRCAVGEANHLPNRDFLEGEVHLHSPLHLLEGALDRRGPGLTQRLRKRDHDDSLGAVAEVESVNEPSPAPAVFPKTAHRPADNNRLPVEAVGISEQFADRDRGGLRDCDPDQRHAEGQEAHHSDASKARTAKAVAASDMNSLRQGSPLLPPCSRSWLSECARQAA